MIGFSPTAEFRLPPPPPKRSWMVADNEPGRLRPSAGEDLTNKTARAFLFAIEPGMRAVEIVGLMHDQVFDIKRTERGVLWDRAEVLVLSTKVGIVLFVTAMISPSGGVQGYPVRVSVPDAAGSSGCFQLEPPKQQLQALL